MNIRVSALLILLATAIPCVAAEDAPRERCANPDFVRLPSSRMEIRAALRSISKQQPELRIAVEKGVRGIVTTPPACIAPKVALDILLAQIGASYCEQDGTISILRRPGACGGVLTTPRPNERIAAHR